MVPGWVGALAVLVALVAAVLALVLATIANRRWATRPRPIPSMTDPHAPIAGAEADGRAETDARATLAEQLTALREEVAALAGRVGEAEDRARAAEPTLDEALGRAGLAQAAATDATHRADQAAASATEALGVAGAAREAAAAAGAAGTTAVAAAQAATTAASTTDPTALRHVAIVRYDAYADVGGRLSYSVALLDDTVSGLVLTTLSGKADVRTYVRAVSGGVGDGTLTDEEQQAVTAAAAGIPGSSS